MSRGWRWLALTVAVALVWGLGWGYYMHRRMNDYHSGTVARGETWQAADGTRYTVLKTEQHAEVEGWSGTVAAPVGSIHLLVQVRVQSATEQSSCLFDLLGAGRELWREDSDLVPRPANDRDKYPTCPVSDERGSEFVYWMGFLVPKDRLSEVKGLYRETMTYRKNPVLALT